MDIKLFNKRLSPFSAMLFSMCLLWIYRAIQVTIWLTVNIKNLNKFVFTRFLENYFSLLEINISALIWKNVINIRVVNLPLFVSGSIYFIFYFIFIHKWNAKRVCSVLWVPDYFADLHNKKYIQVFLRWEREQFLPPSLASCKHYTVFLIIKYRKQERNFILFVLDFPPW